MFEYMNFIKPDVKFEKEFKYNNYAPMFRKKFCVDNVENAKLYVCGLGYGYYYINGNKVSSDLFTAPVSDYNKTLWYNKYDVSHLLKKGENVIAVICGNGWLNEAFSTDWKYNEVPWRDLQKFILKLEISGEIIVKSDDTWKCCPDSAIWFNALRSGEYFDANKYDPEWTFLEFDDMNWGNAIIDKTPPKGTFKECLCEPIREFEIFETKNVIKTGENRYVFDIGQNISGYIRLTVTGKQGDLLTIRYAEQLNEDGTRCLNNMDKYYKESEFQTDKFICSGETVTWSPMFVYHGFRYIEIDGLNSPYDVKVCGVFVHQDVEKRTEFECSNEFLNKLFKAGEYSVYSNLFYSVTDCPTREKLGWTNDAFASCEQLLTDFKIEKLLEKWFVDICDAMKDDGSLPGIVPTSGWGYEWGNGPVSDGVIFEIPYKIYMHTGNDNLLKTALLYYDRYFKYLETRTDEEGAVNFGLNDWARPKAPDADKVVVPVQFINSALIVYFCKIATLAAKLSNKDSSMYISKGEWHKNYLLNNYIDNDGYCKIDKQTAVALLIDFDIYNDIEPLKLQLKRLVETNKFNHNCGMVGLRRLLSALNKCQLQEYAYKVVTASGYPSFSDWFENGATTLWESWDGPDIAYSNSKNHHMYSDFMSWIVKTILGVNIIENTIKFTDVDVSPYYFENLTYAKGWCETVSGKISVSWKKVGTGVELEIEIPDGINAFYRGQKLNSGKNLINENNVVPYLENNKETSVYRKNYLNGIKNLIEKRRAKAEKIKEEYFKNIFVDVEKYRDDFKEMLGWPLNADIPKSIPNTCAEKLSETDEYEILRVTINVIDEINLTGLLFKHYNSKLPLVITQHGMLGTPEIVSGLYGFTSNYNDMTKRILNFGVNTFVPQLLLWDVDKYGVAYDRVEIDAQLKSVGSSITAIEAYAFKRIIDYFETQEYVQNIGMVGLSYGGFYTLVASAVDTRIKSSISCSYFNNRDNSFTFVDWRWQNSSQMFADAEIACLTYPRKLHIQVGSCDEVFKADTAKEEWRRLEKICVSTQHEWLSFEVFDGRHEFCKNDEPIRKLVEELKELKN